MGRSDLMGRKLRSARERRDFSVDYVARMIDVKPRDVEKWERGDDRPSNAELSLLARLYGVELAELLEAPSAEPRAAHEEAPRKETTAEVPPHGADDSAVIGHYLMANERILWLGHPDPAYRARRIPPAARVFMIFWLAFAVYWTYTAFLEGGIFGIFGIPFICVGLYSNFGSYFTESRRKAHLLYAITDKRVIIYDKKHARCVLLMTLSPDLPFFYHAGKDGHGTICLKSNYVPQAPRKRNAAPMGPDPRVHLVDVANAEEVLRILQGTIDGTRHE